MKTIIFLLLSIVSFLPSSNDVPIKNLYDNFIRVEVNKGRYYSLKLFEEGILCKSTNEKYEVIIDFYPLKDLDFKKFKKIQDYLHEHNFFEMSSTYNNPSVVHHTHHVNLLFLNNTEIKRIQWTGGEYKHLEKLLGLVNDLIPNEKRETYSIMPSWVNK